MKRRMISILLAAAMCASLGLAGCGEENSGSTDTVSSGGATSESGGGSASAGDRDEIVVGYVAPFTGALSTFTQAWDWVSEMALEAINADGGIYIEAYDKKLPVRIVVADSESDPTIASEVAQNLVLDEGVDILMGAWTPTDTAPVSAVAERNQIPALLGNSPAESWLESGPYEWCYSIMFSHEEVVKSYLTAVEKLDTNKKVGLLFDSEVDGIIKSDFVKQYFGDAGYEIVDPGRFPASTTDYTSLISQLKDANCEIVIADQTLPNFATALEQFKQLNYVPKTMIIGKAISFESDVTALDGELGNGLLAEFYWDRSFPYTSSLLDMSCEEIATKWEEENGTQYPACELGYDIALLEVLYETLNRCTDLEPATIREAMASVEYEGVYGPLSFGDGHTMYVPLMTGQWLPGETWDYELTLVGSGDYDIIEDHDPVVYSQTTME